MKKILVVSGLTLLLVGCSDNEKKIDEIESDPVEENTESSEKNTTGETSEDNEITEEDLLGEYTFISDNQSTRVIFEENGTLRFLDNSGNKRYSLRESSSRLLIDGEYYLIRKNEQGYKLLSIDENSERTNKDIVLEKQ